MTLYMYGGSLDTMVMDNILPALLRYNGHLTVCRFTVCSVLFNNVYMAKRLPP